MAGKATSEPAKIDAMKNNGEDVNSYYNFNLLEEAMVSYLSKERTVLI